MDSWPRSCSGTGRDEARCPVPLSRRSPMATTATATLADLAVRHPAASRVFYRRGLDFCCHGGRPLAVACEERGLDPHTVLREIEMEDVGLAPAVRWDARPLPELIDHVVGYYHRRLREELPRLVEMAAKV